mmetsp:Transcript_47479/g.75066  ORF Transcript_47479/g.75066 Transcript_47479/m.75066 type:complete len:470 (-) Transcript_47479:84-1493(-)|eukprot:CAMPEP_0169244612 /NCGR_PEP_ID=MMETSP1016-20121227/33740_1 /TAXON_ID=342587 /ORGANISM="Karlodinium micrum, Strain CCMP2283" /LENGTH=469 /DNA_ID=CAMNT_0009325029 /DNA_START=42 /DNA_END=1451 /DNA_ORIENTATION=+
MSINIEEHDDKIFDGPGLGDMVQMSVEEAVAKLEAESATYMGFMMYNGCPGFVRFAKKGTGVYEIPDIGSIHLAYMELEPQDESQLATVPFPDEDDFDLIRPGRGYGFLDGCEPPVSLWMEMSPADMMQGALGDCWLISGLAALAEFPHTIEAVFQQRELTQDGKYDIKLYDYTKGQYTSIQVDDRLPAKGVTGAHDAILAKATVDNEIWPCLLEKAFATLFDTFNLNGGLCSTVFSVMLGLKKSEIDFFYRDDDPDSWQCYNPGLDVLCPSGSQTQIITQTGVTWPDGTAGSIAKSASYIGQVLADYDKRDYVMCAGSNSGSDTTQVGGIAQGHAYSLIQCVNIGGFTLLQLRNPWGHGEWTGDWCDDSPLWQEHPEVEAALQPEVADDGTFWMNLEDFIANYAMICVGKKSCGADKKGKRIINIEDLAAKTGEDPTEIVYEKKTPQQRRTRKKKGGYSEGCSQCSLQ